MIKGETGMLLEVSQPVLVNGSSGLLYRYDGQDLLNRKVEFKVRLHDGAQGIEGALLEAYLCRRKAKGVGEKRKPLTYLRLWDDWWPGRQKIRTDEDGEAVFTLPLPRKNTTAHSYIIKCGQTSVRIFLMSAESERTGETTVITAAGLDDVRHGSPSPDETEITEVTPFPDERPTPPPLPPPFNQPRLLKADGGGLLPDMDLPDLPAGIKEAKRIAREAEELRKKRVPTPEPQADEFQTHLRLMREMIVAQNRTIEQLIRHLNKAASMLRAGRTYQKAYEQAEQGLKRMLESHTASYRAFDASARNALEDAQRVLAIRVEQIEATQEKIHDAKASIEETAERMHSELASGLKGIRQLSKAHRPIREVTADSSLERATHRLGVAAIGGIVFLAVAVIVTLFVF